MKALLAKLQSRKLLLTIATYGLGGYLISQGHVEAGTALIGAANGTYNIGQGLADAKEAALKQIASSVVPVAGQN